MRVRVLVAALCAAFWALAGPAAAQFLPDQFFAVTCTAACTTAVVSTQGMGTVSIQATGTGSGLAFTFQGTNDGGVTWQTLGAVTPTVPGTVVTSASANGFWLVSAAGFSQIRVNLSTISGGSEVFTLEASTRFGGAPGVGGGGGGCALSAPSCAYVNNVSVGGTFTSTGLGTFSNGLSINQGSSAQGITESGLVTDPSTEVFLNELTTTKKLSTGNNANAVLGFTIEHAVNQGIYNDTAGADQAAGYFHNYGDNFVSTTPGYISNLTGVESWADFAVGAYGNVTNVNAFVRHTPNGAVAGQAWVDNSYLLEDLGAYDNTFASINYGVVSEQNAFSIFGGTTPYGNVHSRVNDQVGTATASIAGTVLTLTSAITPVNGQGAILPNCSIVTGGGTSAGTVITGSSPATTWYPTYTVNNSQSVGSATLTFTCHPPAFVADNYTSRGSADIEFLSSSSVLGYIHAVNDATYGNKIAMGVTLETGKDSFVVTNQGATSATTAAELGYVSPTFGYMLDVYGSVNTNGGASTAAVATTVLTQLTGGSTLFAVNSATGISAGELVTGLAAYGTTVNTVASINSTAQFSFNPNAAASGQATILYASAATAQIGMICADTTGGHGGYLLNGAHIASVSVGTSITLSSNIQTTLPTSDTIKCYSTVTLGTATTSAAPIATPISFFTQHTTVGTTSNFTDQSDANIWGTLVAGNTVYLTGVPIDTGQSDHTVCEVTSTGEIYYGSGTGGICLTTSSARFKDRIEDMRESMSDLMGLRPVGFNYKPGNGYDPAHRYNGFIAEEMEKVLPNLVGHDASGKANSIDLMGLVPIMVSAIQRQQWEIRALMGAVVLLALWCAGLTVLVVRRR